MKILVTGGHMAPALSLIQTLPKEDAVVYVGRSHVFEGDTGASLEQTTIQHLGIPFVELQTGRLQRKLSAYTMSSLLKIPKGVIQSLMILKKEKPDVVVGFGGYLSVPIGLAAFLLRIPIIIHEQTLSAGLANKLLAPFATTICISWPSSAVFFPKKKTILTGNPLLKKEPLKKVKLPTSQLPLVVVAGGSGGSHAINVLIEENLHELLSVCRVVHQTGDAQEFGDYSRLKTLSATLPEDLQKRYVLTQFIPPSEVESLFEKADVVVGRSGINTVSLLMHLKKPAILIPLPSGQKNEQLANAKLYSSSGLGVVLPQTMATGSSLFKQITAMINKPPVVKDSNLTTGLIEKAAENIVRQIQCIKESKKENLTAS